MTRYAIVHLCLGSAPLWVDSETSSDHKKALTFPTYAEAEAFRKRAVKSGLLGGKKEKSFVVECPAWVPCNSKAKPAWCGTVHTGCVHGMGPEHCGECHRVCIKPEVAVPPLESGERAVRMEGAHLGDCEPQDCAEGCPFHKPDGAA